MSLRCMSLAFLVLVSTCALSATPTSHRLTTHAHQLHQGARSGRRAPLHHRLHGNSTHAKTPAHTALPWLICAGTLLVFWVSRRRTPSASRPVFVTRGGMVTKPFTPRPVVLDESLPDDDASSLDDQSQIIKPLWHRIPLTGIFSIKAPPQAPEAADKAEAFHEEIVSIDLDALDEDAPADAPNRLNASDDDAKTTKEPSLPPPPLPRMEANGTRKFERRESKHSPRQNHRPVKPGELLPPPLGRHFKLESGETLLYHTTLKHNLLHTRTPGAFAVTSNRVLAVFCTPRFGGMPPWLNWELRRHRVGLGDIQRVEAVKVERKVFLVAAAVVAWSHPWETLLAGGFFACFFLWPRRELAIVLRNGQMRSYALPQNALGRLAQIIYRAQAKRRKGSKSPLPETKAKAPIPLPPVKEAG